MVGARNTEAAAPGLHGRALQCAPRHRLRSHCVISVDSNIVRHLLRHSVDHTNMEMHMPVQTGAESVDEGHGANVQGGDLAPEKRTP